MTTITKNIPAVKAEKFNARAFLSFAFAKASESVGDMIITVAVTGIFLVYIVMELPMYINTSIPGLLIIAAFMQLFIRIAHRFDDHYTTDELAQRVIEMEDSINEKLNRIEANQ